MASYLKLKEVATTMKYFGRAFSDKLANDEYFTQCPAGFNRYKMSSFCKLLNSEEVQELCRVSRQFQDDTVQKWNSNANDVTLSIFFGLLG